jgi:hypothetical protein
MPWNGILNQMPRNGILNTIEWFNSHFKPHARGQKLFGPEGHVEKCRVEQQYEACK